MEQKPSQIRLDGVRFSWVFVFEKDDSEEPKFRVTVLVNKKDKKSVAKLQAALKYAFMEGVKDPKIWAGNKPKKWKNPIHDGDEPNDDGSARAPELKGMLYFTASSKKPIPVLDKYKKELESDDDFYSGCIGSIMLTLRAYKNKSIGIGVYMNGICKTDDGERLGGGTINTNDAFGDLFEESADDDDDIFSTSKKSTKKEDDDDSNPWDNDGEDDDDGFTF